MAARADLIADLDLALAALRRVIVRAIDGHPADPPAETKVKIARSAPAPRKPEAPAPPPVEANGVTIDFAAGTISHANKSISISPRHAQALAVLAYAKPNLMRRADIIARAWPDVNDNVGQVRLSELKSAVENRLSAIDLAIYIERGIGLALRDANSQ